MSCFRNIFYNEENKSKSQSNKNNLMTKDGAEHLVYISDRLILPTFRSQVIGLKPSKGFRTEEQKNKLREILHTPTGFIHLVNEYEEMRELTYLKLIKKQAKEKAIDEYCSKNKLSGVIDKKGSMVQNNIKFNPYRDKEVVFNRLLSR